MASYKIFFKRSVEKDLAIIPKEDIKKILCRIKKLADDPRPPGCEKLTGQDRYRIRQGRFRILYTILDNNLCVWIVKVAHRKDAYR
jgi:mRNA interferase RelE/StbE